MLVYLKPISYGYVMLYIAEINNKICNPVNENTLKVWAESGRISPDTKISPKMLQHWKKASEYDFLSTVFNKSCPADDARSKLSSNSIPQFKGNIIRASWKVRLVSGIIDIFILFLILLATSFIFNLSSPENYEVIYKCFLVLAIFSILLYLGVCLGIFRRTVGMRFTGIMILSQSYVGENVLPLQGFKAAILMLVFGIISPLTYYVFGNKRTLHDIFGKTQIVYSSLKYRR